MSVFLNPGAGDANKLRHNADPDKEVSAVEKYYYLKRLTGDLENRVDKLSESLLESGTWLDAETIKYVRKQVVEKHP